MHCQIHRGFEVLNGTDQVSELWVKKTDRVALQKPGSSTRRGVFRKTSFNLRTTIWDNSNKCIFRTQLRKWVKLMFILTNKIIYVCLALKAHLTVLESKWFNILFHLDLNRYKFNNIDKHGLGPGVWAKSGSVSFPWVKTITIDIVPPERMQWVLVVEHSSKSNFR